MMISQEIAESIWKMKDKELIDELSRPNVDFNDSYTVLVTKVAISRILKKVIKMEKKMKELRPDDEE